MQSDESERETHIDDELGLFVPKDLREFDAQIVFRTPRATIQHFGSQSLDGYYGMIHADQFGDPDEMRDPKNPELAPDRVKIKPQGEEPVTLTVETEPEIRTDGGHSVDGTEQARLDVGDTRKTIAIKDEKRVTTGDLAALSMCAHRYDPDDVMGWYTHDYDDVIRQWIASNVGSVFARLSPHCEYSRGECPPLHRSHKLSVEDADDGPTQTKLMTDGGQVEVGTERREPSEDPAACSRCGVHIGLASDDYCEPCAREIGAKPPMQRCMGCGKSYPQEWMDSIDVSPEDEYYPEFRHICPDCSGGESE